jgi:hypothetical protein
MGAPEESMYDPGLDTLRRKLVSRMRTDPPRLAGVKVAVGPELDRWVASRFSSAELASLLRLDRQYGEDAVADWFTEILLEAGVVRPPRLDS